MLELIVRALAVLNQILSAGISITAFSFLLYALTFNLRDRVARSFAVLLACVTVVYFCDTVVSTAAQLEAAAAWLRLQWLPPPPPPRGRPPFFSPPPAPPP